MEQGLSFQSFPKKGAFKLVCAIFIKFLLFQQMTVLQKLKDAFYFIEKALFILEIFKFLYFPLPLFFSLSAIALEDD